MVPVGMDGSPGIFVSQTGRRSSTAAGEFLKTRLLPIFPIRHSLAGSVSRTAPSITRLCTTSSSMRSTRAEASRIQPPTIVSFGIPYTGFGTLPPTLGAGSPRPIPQCKRFFPLIFLFAARPERFPVATNLTSHLHPTSNLRPS